MPTAGGNLRAGRSGSSTDAKSEEKGGGRDEDEASETGYCGGGGECSATSWSAGEEAPLVAVSWLAARRSQCTKVSTDSGDAEGPVPASRDADNAADYQRLRSYRRGRVFRFPGDGATAKTRNKHK
ncbi:hypothetical protein HC256_009330 [Beauveria bassiana]|nr:hypothetical protein HC256_009330 [Beauveria bassiana]